MPLADQPEIGTFSYQEGDRLIKRPRYSLDFKKVSDLQADGTQIIVEVNMTNTRLRIDLVCPLGFEAELKTSFDIPENRGVWPGKSRLIKKKHKRGRGNEWRLTMDRLPRSKELPTEFLTGIQCKGTERRARFGGRRYFPVRNLTVGVKGRKTAGK